MAAIRKRFVIHEHHARRLHYDLRLEMDGVLRSWAVPKGPSLKAGEKRLAVAVPDHSLSYINFEGKLPEGTYGAGKVRIWDDGKYETASDPGEQVRRGKLVFTFFGLKLRGEFALVKIARQEDNWLLIKANDHFADPNWKLEPVLPPENKSESKKPRSRRRAA
jgi:bifunctional non-homologous end joining protein LigD